MPPHTRHVVVDGSNLATEGRTLPSLAQLDEAVRAYSQEDPRAEIVVVVDASFEHRIDQQEREQLEQAELHGEVVSPPAGAIGRGDAFVLRIAERTGATVLSNDSFQEFHAEHPWLFDEGRLVGGKPVPGVGWIFTPRIPVRGPRSRQATGKAKRAAGRKDGAALPPPEKAAELARAAKKAAKAAKATKKTAAPRRPARNADGTTPKVGDVWVGASAAADGDAAGVASAAGQPDGSAPAPTRATKATKATKAAKAAAKAVKATKAAKAAGKTAKATKAAKAAGKTAKATKATKATKPASVAEPAIAARKAGKSAKAAPAGGAEGGEPARPLANRRRAAAGDPEIRKAIVTATVEALEPELLDQARGKGKEHAGKGGKKRRRPAAPLPAVNEPLAFITFVAAYPIGTVLEGEVASYTSHGAMIDVDLPAGGQLHCYVPLSGLGDPPPPKAREVLTRGERRQFALVSLDPPRRVAELALAGAV